MANINELLARAAALRDETALNSISPERAGGIMYDTLLAMNELWLQQGAALVISKIYASVADMEADTAPVSDLTGKPLRPGQIVVIASSDSDNGSVYRYNGTEAPRWSLVGSIGNLEPVDNLESDSTALPLAAHQGKVLDGKISQLGQDTNDKNLITREYVMSAINDGKATISKNSILFSTGYYGITDGVIIHYTGVHNCVKIPAAGYYLDKIVFRGTFVGVLGAQNVILERNDGEVFSYTIGVEGESINLSDYFSHSVEAEKLKNVYINYFFIDDNDYKFEFQFDRLNAPVDTMTVGEQGAIKGSSLYSEIGVPIENEGYLDIYGNFASTSYWRTSDFIPVVLGDIIKYRLSGQAGATATIAFYDKDKIFISGLLPSTTGVVSGTMTVPNGCEYMRCCVIRDQEPTSYCFVDSLLSFKEQFNQLKDRVVSPVALFDTIKKPIVFSGKVLHAFGDSITAGVSSPNLAPAGENSYINLFKAYAGATLLNYADSGACIVPGRNEVTSIYEKIISISSACDIIMIAGGVNDWQTQSPIGAFGDDNTTTLYGTLKKICDYLKTTYPNAIVIFITPIPTTNTTTFGVQHPDNLNLYRKAIQEVAAYYGYNVVNGAGLGLPDFLGGYGDAMFDATDCVHPTLAGHLLYARSLCGKLL